MPNTSSWCLGCLLGLLVPATSSAQTGADSAAFVTRLGVDTLVVERFVYTATRVEAEVLLRVPTTTRTRYVLQLSPRGVMTRFEAITTMIGDAEPVRRETVERAGDSLRIETVAGDASRSRMVAAETTALPFLDMVHWPFEIATRRQRAAGTSLDTVPLLTGSRTAPFVFAAAGPDSVTITHPTRGTMRAAVDAAGRLLGLDAGATTRRLVVERQPTLALEPIAARWAALDAAGRSAGALSGRAEVQATVTGVTITIDHGTPAKRGREIWGALVPYGQVWRTGANQATHFTTDSDLVLGAGERTLLVPAGAYTLFSVPSADGGLLIVNRQTGQTGTAYDATRDLGRVPLEWRPLADSVEVFTIAVTEEGDGGWLRLRWDRRELVVRVRRGGSAP